MMATSQANFDDKLNPDFHFAFIITSTLPSYGFLQSHVNKTCLSS